MIEKKSRGYHLWWTGLVKLFSQSINKLKILTLNNVTPVVNINDGDGSI